MIEGSHSQSQPSSLSAFTELSPLSAFTETLPKIKGGDTKLCVTAFKKLYSLTRVAEFAAVLSFE